MGNWAFFSYARADSAAAEKLHAALDRYRTPGDLVTTDGANGPVPKTFHPVFRDVSDLSGGGHLNDKIQQALADSTCLVVLCSPAAAASPWVNIECETFIAQGKAARIFPVIAPDLPAAGDRDELFEETFFPPALRGKGFLAADLRETISASGKPVGDGEDNGRMKLIAGLLGVPLDALIKREARRQRRLVGMLGAAALVFAGVAAAAVVQTFTANSERARAVAGETLAEQNALEADRERDAAIAARAEAERNAREREEQRQLADRNADQARIQELAATANAREASAQRDAARNALARIFAERSWQAIENDNYLLAARYALAGLRVSPANEQEFRLPLARIVHDTVESRTFFIGGLVGGIVFSPDGQHFVTGSLDRSTARIWSTSGEGEPIDLAGHSGGITHFEYSTNGTHVLTGSYLNFDSESVDWTARVWDARTGRLIQTFGGGDNPLQDAHFIGRDGAVVTASRDGVVRVLNAESGDETLVLRGSSGLTGVAASADGSRIYVENWGLIKVWDASGTERLDLQIGSRGTISPDGTQVATSGSEIVIVDVNGDHQRTTLSSDPWAASMLFSPNGELIAAFGLDVGVRIWNARTGAAVATLPPQRSGVSCFAFSPDGTLAVTGSGRGDIQLWEIASGRRIATLRGHFGRITDVAFNQQGTNIATASIDGTVRIWPVAGLRAIATLYPGDGVVDAALDAAGSRIFAVTNNGAPLGSTTHVWDARTLRLLTEDDSLESAFGLADSRAGFIAFDFRNTRREGAAVGFDILRRRPVVDLRPHESQITGVEYSQDGRFILTSTMGGIVRVWRAPTEHIATLPHDQFVGDAAFNGDGTQIVTASVDGAARIWRASDPERRSWSISATLRGHTLGLSQARFSADSRFIVSASGDHTARIWDASTGRLLRVLSGHEEAVTSASFSESGANVLTSSRDGTARLWDASSGRTIVVLGDLGSPVLQARFGSSDTNVILAAEGGVQVWDIASALLPTQNLTAAVCSWLLLPMNGSRTFLATEADADPLVRDVWGGQASERDVCEGVPGIPPVTRQSPQLRVRAQ